MENMLRGSLTSTTDAKGVLGFKGERGYSAYEIAVLHGYEGTEQDWIDHFGLDLSGYVQTSDVVDNLTSTETTHPLSAKQGKVLKDGLDGVLNLVYPVGSIYMSVNSTSPATLFGGTWVQIKDTFLLSAGDTYTAGNTGGEATHTLTTTEMPSHSHNAYLKAPFSIQTNGGNEFAALYNSGTSSNAYITNTGGGQAHNNMPPYLVVYMWKRTA